MTLDIRNFILGPMENNTYAIIDRDNSLTAMIDPSVPSREIINFLNKEKLELAAILVTHAHFDHIGGVNWLKKACSDDVPVVMHQADLGLWQHGGGAKEFGIELDHGMIPDQLISMDSQLIYGNIGITLLHTPGHSPGHVTYHLPSKNAAFCGDLIFKRGVGRTDLYGSNHEQLVESILTKIFDLPDRTTLYPGHGPETTVGEEKMNNPYT